MAFRFCLTSFATFIMKLFHFDVQFICALFVLSDLTKGWGVKVPHALYFGP